MRREALIDITRNDLSERMQAYFDASLDWESAVPLIGGLATKAGAFDPKACRAKLLKAESFDPKRIVRYSLYPFDNRWCYHTNTPYTAALEQAPSKTRVPVVAWQSCVHHSSLCRAPERMGDDDHHAPSS
jgi:hypothetical protein